MEIELAVLQDTGSGGAPGAAEFTAWARAALEGSMETQDGCFSMTIRIVEEDESRRLNREYRDRDQPTNVLSFPVELPAAVLEELEARPLGDLAICAPLICAEATEQGKAVNHHWAHMTVHGVLHLLGFDHQDPGSANRMESLERGILGTFGIPDPY